MKILALAGSNSCHSINFQLLEYVTQLVQPIQVELIPHTNFNLPLYSIDMEEFVGIPDSVQLFTKKLNESQGLILSVAEHNGNITAYLKNLLDWMSRHDHRFLANTKVFLLSASSRLGGGRQAVHIMQSSVSLFGGEVTAQFSIGGFEPLFLERQVYDQRIAANIRLQLRQFIRSLFRSQYVLQAS